VADCRQFIAQKVQPMQNPYPDFAPQRDAAPLRLVQAARPPRHTWSSTLPLGEFLVIAAFGLVLILA
jgi:hypothetical protein